jgi:hypothetical protein
LNKEKFLYDLTTLENNLNLFTYEDYSKELANDLKRNLFALLKVTKSFDEYLDQINAVNFKPTDFMYNKGHRKDREAFGKAKDKLLSVIDIVKQETNFGKLDNVELVKPPTISIPWILNNTSPRIFWWVGAIIISLVIISFTLGKNF